MKAKRHDRGAILLVLAIMAITVVLAILAAAPSGWLQEKPRARPPLPLDLIEPATTAGRPARGMTVGPHGYGTLLSAPPRRVEPSPDLPRPPEEMLPAAPAIAADVAGTVRLLARLAPIPSSDELIVTTLEAPPRRFSKVILRDGCLRLAEPGEPHAVFPAGTRLYVDDQGFLTIGALANGDSVNPRVGELLWWEDRQPPQLDPAAVPRIRERCGPGAVKFVGLVQSVAASRALADALAATNFAKRYGVPWNEALRRVRTCRAAMGRNLPDGGARMIDNMCGSTPPSPVVDPQSCPPGTSLSGGLCRTPEGYIRPIPAAPSRR